MKSFLVMAMFKLMDFLDKLLAFSQITGGVNIKCQLQGDWQLDSPHQAGMAIAHIVSKGTAYLSLDPHKPAQCLQAGDIVLITRALPHQLSHSPHLQAHSSVPSQQYQQGSFLINQIGQGESDCELFCLHFYYDAYAELMNNLPEMIRLNIQHTSLHALFDMLKIEAENTPIATVSVVNALSLVVLTLILRVYLAEQDAHVLGTLKGWQEPRLRPLLKAILQQPEQAWHIETMAHLAHLSRSQLIRLFNKHLEISPHAFVHKIRLQKAAMLLKQKSDSILSIALSTGFQSETHFSKAFKKMYGQTPSAYRQPT